MFLFFGNISATICKNLIFKFFHLVRKATDGALSFGYRFDGKNKPNFLSKFIVHYGAKKSLIVKKNKKRMREVCYL